MRKYIQKEGIPQLLRKRAGMSLVEIMVIVCLIGFFAAFAYANYKEFLSTSSGAACSSNLRQLGNAILLYAADNGGTLPGPGGTTLSFLPTSTNTVSVLIAPYIQDSFNFEKDKGRRELDLLRCPGLRLVEPGYAAKNITITYIPNYADDNAPFGNPSANSSNAPKPKDLPKRLDYFTNASKIWCIADVDNQFGIATAWASNQTGPPRHKNVRNYLFLDDHVEPISIDVPNKFKPVSQ